MPHSSLKCRSGRSGTCVSDSSGIQFGFALQNANISRIFQTLGASIDDLPILWIAAPLTGLLVQPIIGYYSDRTWNRLGRRRPYFLAGAMLASLALIAMPRSPVLWMAAGTAVDPRRQHQHRHGAVPRLRRRSAAGTATARRLSRCRASSSAWARWSRACCRGSSRTRVSATSARAAGRRDSRHGALFVRHRRRRAGGAMFWTIFTTREYPPPSCMASPMPRHSPKASTPGSAARRAARAASLWLGGRHRWRVPRAGSSALDQQLYHPVRRVRGLGRCAADQWRRRAATACSRP